MIEIRVVGLDELQKRNDEVGVWAKGPFRGRAAGKIRDDFLDEVGDSFSSRGRSTGTSWAPLSPAYASWKNSAYPGRPLLVLTGRMRDSFRAGSRDLIYNRKQQGQGNFGHKRLPLGTRVPYAGYHQSGTSKMPRRPLFVVNRQIANRWGKYLSADLQNAMKGKRWQDR